MGAFFVMKAGKKLRTKEGRILYVEGMRALSTLLCSSREMLAVFVRYALTLPERASRQGSRATSFKSSASAAPFV